jgi:hypothetical protein
MSVERARVVASALRRLTKAGYRSLLRQSDRGRWEDERNFESWWDTRTQMLASFVPEGSRVLEFGAGRCQLERYLPSGCIYFGSDLTSRTPDTIVCDLNARPLPDLRQVKADVVVFGGVLEYVGELPSLSRWLSRQTRSVVASYDCMRSPKWSAAWIAELANRMNFGYLSHYSLDQLTLVFEQQGFRLVKTDQWHSQVILVFELEDSNGSGKPLRRVTS